MTADPLEGSQYRIRWSNRVVGAWTGYRRMCLAEKLVRVLWCEFYWPIDANWRDTEDQALADIDADVRLCQPLPETRYLNRT